MCTGILATARRVLVVAVGSQVGLSAHLLCAQTGATSKYPNRIEIDHHKECPASDGKLRLPTCEPTRSVWVNAGDPFTVVILNTDTTRFTYTIRGLEPVKSPEVKDSTKVQLSEGPTHTKVLAYSHNPAFRGYVITIAAVKPFDRNDLGDMTLTLRARESKFDVAVAGGFSLATIRNDPFVIRAETTGGAATHVVALDEARRDDASVGVATFATAYHTREPWLGISFGLGIATTAGTQYYFGPSIRFGEAAILNFGYTLGRVDVLPAGTQVGDTVTDLNILQNLGKRSKSGLFVGLAYTFVGGGKAELNKPFAGTTPQSGK